jgi:hypothetical protein
MPITTRCPECDRPLRVPDELVGKNVKCPGCTATFVAEAESDGQPAESIRPTPEIPASNPSEAIRESPPPPADGPAADGLPDEPRQPLPRPRLDDDDEDDDDEDDDEMDERLVERRAKRRRTQRLERARRVVKAPAIGLMVVAGSFFLAALGGTGFAIFFAVNMGRMAGPGPAGPPIMGGLGVQDIYVGFYLVGAGVECVLGGLTLYGAIKMRKLQAWGLALTVSILAIVASFGSCCVISVFGVLQVGLALTFGIWSTIALNDADVKASFT